MSTNPQAQHRSKIGRIGEQLAADFLSHKGYIILERNFKARYGEIDIIARDRDTLVFVEVKTRIGTRFGLPEEAVTFRKVRELITTSLYYKQTHTELSDNLRIDVVAIQLNGETFYADAIRHIINISS